MRFQIVKKAMKSRVFLFLFLLKYLRFINLQDLRCFLHSLTKLLSIYFYTDILNKTNQIMYYKIRSIYCYVIVNKMNKNHIFIAGNKIL